MLKVQTKHWKQTVATIQQRKLQESQTFEFE